jgi:hypothetical protein
MNSTNISVQDLTEATASAVKLSKIIGQPTVIVGAFAMAAHGYRRETNDVDIVIPVVIGAAAGDMLEAAAKNMGLVVRAKHGFGGLNLRAGDVRIHVVTLDRDVPTLVPDAVKEAVASKRRMKLFGHSVFVVSLGHLVAMKLVAERKKDIADSARVDRPRRARLQPHQEHSDGRALVGTRSRVASARAVRRWRVRQEHGCSVGGRGEPRRACAVGNIGCTRVVLDDEPSWR